MPPNGYDYRTSSVDEDRRRAKEVYDRVEQKLSRENGAHGVGNTNGQTGQTSDDERQAQAVKRIQGGYRCALFSAQSLCTHCQIASVVPSPAYRAG